MGLISRQHSWFGPGDEQGKRKQMFKSGFARKLDADIELARMVNDRNERSLVRPDPRTFAEFSEAMARGILAKGQDGTG